MKYMNRNTPVSVFLILNLLLFKVNIAFGQAPKISYPTPQTYTVNTPITTLTPTNSGGAVPANIYGQPVVLAGSGSQGNNNGNGTAASFYNPTGTATDAAGNIYVADRGNFLIRKITPAGVVTTFAGSGVSGNADGQGTAASFKGPSAIATDAAGNIYVADTYGNEIRKITPGGLVTTIAGNATPGENNGPAASATFNQPQGIVLDASGNIYISEFSNYIRKIGTDGIVSTLAGNGTAGNANGQGTVATFDNPQKLTVDAAGNVYVADFGSNFIRKISSAGLVTTVNFQPVIQINRLGGVAVDAIGDLYFSDSGNNRIGKIAPSGHFTILTSGLNINSTGVFSFPLGLSIDASGNLYVANFGDNNIVKVFTTGYSIDRPLPPGLVFDATTGKISGIPTAQSLSINYTVTAYNAGGSSSFIINIQVIPGLTFKPIPDKTVCDIDFTPDAISTAGSVTYTSSNTAVATIIANKIHITGPGTTIIAATDGISTSTQTLTVNPAVTPSVSILPVTVNECQGTPVTFTATPTNGGTTPIYQWGVNGIASGTGPTFTSSILNNGDIVSCILTSNAVCTTSASTQSNLVTVIINKTVTTTIAITSSPNGHICAGTPVTFTARADLSTAPGTSGGNPVYQWEVNGNNAGINSPTFTSNNLADGDVVTCIFTSNENCVINPQAESNPIPIVFNPVSVCEIIIPNTFTPNGDGINDLWNITALQNFPECIVNIYTRYGSLIYNSVGYSKAWDGTYNGKALPVGVYYYVIDLKTGSKPLAGSITILR